MCGIFGLAKGNHSNLSSNSIEQIINNLFVLSESRGKEASGAAISTANILNVIKAPLPAPVFIKKQEYKNFIRKKVNKFYPITVIGQTRLATNGSIETNQNNQPIIKDGAVAIHNGIIVNDQDLWKKFSSLNRNYEVDTEVFLSLLQKFKKETNSVIKATIKTYNLLEGSASVAVLFNDNPYLLLATNTGSLYYCKSESEKILVFASEYFILEKLLNRKLKKSLSSASICQIKSGNGLLINCQNLSTKKFNFSDQNSKSENLVKILPHKEIHRSSIEKSNQTKNNFENKNLSIQKYDQIMKKFAKTQESVNKLRRCSRCILPETMPFIKFDNEGVCNYCRSYKRMEIKGKESLEKVVEPYRGRGEKPDCIVAFSGGRDSSYGLHYIKTVLKMNPVAYSYDWGMLTDLGRRNQARMCGKLGVEHILISADITNKREYIRKNVEAWLKKPDLGIIPLFMAGDKQYFYYANKLRKQLGINLVILCVNPLEKTDFKSGFCGVPPNFNTRGKIYALSVKNKIKMASYYTNQYLSNWSYLNSSIFDTLSAYISYYLISHNYLHLYKYIKWEEEKINSTLIKKYNWEVSQDTKTTWRIGDGTAAFYNYIYYCIAGFTENDTFRSNQIREGTISRHKAIILSRLDNQPRFESIKWYCNTISINFEAAIKKINNAPKLYSQI